MKLDASQLEKTEVIISNDGRICQFTLTNRDGDHLRFRMTYRQLPYYASAIKKAAGEMQRRLAENGEARAAEMAAALRRANASPRSSANCRSRSFRWGQACA